MWLKITFVTISVLMMLAVWVRWWQKRWLRKYKLKELDVPVSPIAGHLWIAVKGIEYCTERIVDYVRITSKQGGMATVWFSYIPVIAITDPTKAEFILKNHLEKGCAYKFGHPILGNGSFIADVPIWRHRRKICAPLFAPKNLSLFVEIFAQQSATMTKLMEKAVGRGPTELWHYILMYSFDAVCNTTLGINIDAQNNQEHHFPKTLMDFCNAIVKRIMSPWLFKDSIYKRLPMYQSLLKLKKSCYGFVEEVIHLNEETKKSVTNDLQHKIPNLLELMSQNKDNGLSIEEQCEEVLLFLFAGMDTSAVGISFTLHMLARHQDVQEKVYQELMKVFDDVDKPVNETDYPKLQYLDCVIKESLRLYPPGPLIGRTVETEAVLPSGETIPAGTFVVICILGIHRNPDYWGADADQFRPERFLQPFKHPKQFIPFSDGPRNCIGYKYAMMSMKTALATMLRKYKVFPANPLTDYKNPHVKFSIDILLKDKQNVRLCLESRNFKNNKTM